MKLRTKLLLLVAIILAALASCAIWLNPLRPVFRARSRIIDALRAADHAELLASCRSVMAEAHTFTNDGEVMSWHSGWQASLNRDSLQ